MAIKTKAELHIQNDNWITTNNNEEITGAILNSHLGDIIDSYENIFDQTIVVNVDPTATDDDYDIGQHWINTDTDSIFILVDNLPNNAIWNKLLIERGSSPYYPIEMQYNAIIYDMNNNNLKPYSWYKVLDYATTTLTGSDSTGYVIYNADIEPILIQANSLNSFNIDGFIASNRNEQIKYDINDDEIVTNMFGGWDASGGDFGEEITISNVQSTSFDINRNINPDDSNFYMYIEDSSNDYEYDSGDFGTAFNITDLGSGQYRITINDTIDLLDGSGYIEIEGDVSLQNRTGIITYRFDTDKNIKASFDFKGVRRLRKKADTSAIPVYDNSTTYNYKDIVIYNDVLWICITPTSLNNTPNTNYDYWVILIDKVSTSYVLGSYSYYSGVNIPVDDVNTKLMPVFGIYNHSTETSVYQTYPVKDIELLSEDVVFYLPNGTERVYNVKINENCNNITLNSYVDNIEFPNRSYNIIKNDNGHLFYITIKNKVRYTIFNNTVYDNVFEGVTSSVLSNLQNNNIDDGSYMYLSNMFNSKIGKLAYNIRIRGMNNSEIGLRPNNCYWYRLTGDKIGMYATNILSYTTNHMNNTIGDYMKNIEILSPTIHFKNNTIGHYFGGNTVSDKFIISSSISDSIFNNYTFNYGTNTLNGITNSTFGNHIHDIVCGDYINSSTFGNSIYNFSIGTQIGRSSFGNNVSNINTTYDISSSTFENGVASITADLITRTIIQNGIYNIECESLIDCVFYGNSSNITATGIDLKNNNIYVGSWNPGSTPTHVRNVYACDIFYNESHQIKLSYINSSNTLSVVDVTD